MEKIVKDTLAAMIDHTFLKPDGAPDAVERLCREALEWHFGCVMVNPCEVANCAALLGGSDVKVGTVIGFPLGQCTLAAMRGEALDAIANGAAELDFVINVRALRRACASHAASGEGDGAIAGLPFTQGYRELLDAVRTAKKDIVTKIIIETCYLSDDEKVFACKAAKAAGFDFVKTSTGFGTGGATVHDVALMRAAVGPDMGVKAAGGIRSLADAVALVEAGATRLGCSAGVSIMNELATTR